MGTHRSSYGSRSPADPATAEHSLAVVENGCLARRYGTRGSVEDQFGIVAVFTGVKRRRHRRLRGPELCHNRPSARRRRAKPVDLAESNSGLGERSTRTDEDAARPGIETQNVERLCRGDPQPLSLTYREMCDAAVMAEHAARRIDNIPGLTGLGSQPLDEPRIRTLRHKANVLAVGLVGDGQAKTPCRCAGLVFGEPAEREAQKIELRARRCKQKITLVSASVPRPVQLGSVRPHHPAHVMPGGERRSTEMTCGAKQIAELDPLIAANARDWRFAAAIGFGKIVDYFRAKAALVIQHVMRNAEPVGNACRVADVPAGAAHALPPDRGAVVVELQGDADNLVAVLDQEGRGHRRIDAARHRDNDPVVRRAAWEVEIRGYHGRASRPICQKSASSPAARAKLAARVAKRPSPPRRANCSLSAASASRARP